MGKRRASARQYPKTREVERDSPERTHRRELALILALSAVEDYDPEWFNRGGAQLLQALDYRPNLVRGLIALMEWSAYAKWAMLREGADRIA